MIEFVVIAISLMLLAGILGYMRGSLVESERYLARLNIFSDATMQEIQEIRDGIANDREDSLQRLNDLEARTTEAHVKMWMSQRATEEYARYFAHRFDLTPTLISDILVLDDHAAIEALKEESDDHSWAWPTEAHPNYEFVNIFLDHVDWFSVLTTLRVYKTQYEVMRAT